jgi:hypothetical protein
MPDSTTHNWTILGSDDMAEALREAAPFRPAPRPLTISTDPANAPADTFVLGPAALSSQSERTAPWQLAFEAVGEVERALRAGEVGQVYGCFGSCRLARAATSEQVSHEALLPLLATTLHLLDRQVTRVWARRSSLLEPDDAWFVTAALDDETLLTLEALAVNDAPGGAELLIEVTGAERVLRAEPLRQAVVVERVGAAPASYPWWEDEAERYLAVVISAAAAPPTNAGSRLRAVWKAIVESATSGAPVTLAG